MANQPSKVNNKVAASPYYANYMANKGNANQSSAGRPMQRVPMSTPYYGAAPMMAPQQTVRPAAKSAAKSTVKPMPQYTEKQAKKIERQRKRQSSHFFVMRKGVCFLMFICSLLVVAMLALSFLEIMPSFTSIYAIPDNTPLDERVAADSLEDDLDISNAASDEVAEDDALTEDELLSDVYVDATEYVGVADLIYGLANGMFALGLVDEEGVSLSIAYDETLASIQAVALEYPEDSMASIAAMMYEYMPLAIAVLAVVAIISLIMSFFALFGRRIFKGFGLMGIIMTLCSVVVFIAGLATLGLMNGNPVFAEDGTITSLLDFSQLSGFLTRIISSAPATALDPLVDIMPVVYCAGIGMLAILVAPILQIVLSIFARRKLPYSIFDK
ncbi:MAG: hypothetical protein R3Y23_00455 [Bacillota bacterium]